MRIASSRRSTPRTSRADCPLGCSERTFRLRTSERRTCLCTLGPKWPLFTYTWNLGACTTQRKGAQYSSNLKCFLAGRGYSGVCWLSLTPTLPASPKIGREAWRYGNENCNGGPWELDSEFCLNDCSYLFWW